MPAVDSARGVVRRTERSCASVVLESRVLRMCMLVDWLFSPERVTCVTEIVRAAAKAVQCCCGLGSQHDAVHMTRCCLAQNSIRPLRNPPHRRVCAGGQGCREDQLVRTGRSARAAWGSGRIWWHRDCASCIRPRRRAHAILQCKQLSTAHALNSLGKPGSPTVQRHHPESLPVIAGKLPHAHVHVLSNIHTRVHRVAHTCSPAHNTTHTLSHPPPGTSLHI